MNSLLKFDGFLYFVSGLILLVNISGFIIIGIDKFKAKKRKWRIPEKTFFFVAVFGGSIGVYTGMLFFRHKTRHWYFMVGIPAIIIVEILIALFITHPLVK